MVTGFHSENAVDKVITYLHSGHMFSEGLRCLPLILADSLTASLP